MRKYVMAGGLRIDYELEYKQVKNINIRVKADGTVHVSANRRNSNAAVENAILSNAAGIVRALEKMEKNKKSVPTPSDYSSGEKLCVLGFPLTIDVRQGTINTAYSENNMLVISVRDPSDRSQRERAVEKWLTKLCSAVITSTCSRYLPYFSAYCGNSIPELRFRKMKARWGSCMPEKRILTFNTRLAQVPGECIDYVVVHEFAHFIHPDHSKQFYDEVSNVLPEWKRLRTELRKYETLMT